MPIPPPTRPKKAAKALEGSKPSGEEGESKADAVQQAEQAEEETPPAFDPCLPRYCTVCTGKNAELDARCGRVAGEGAGVTGPQINNLIKKYYAWPRLAQGRGERMGGGAGGRAGGRDGAHSGADS